jgi:NitT/TauT family transport system substrate-binding protein
MNRVLVVGGCLLALCLLVPSFAADDKDAKKDRDKDAPLKIAYSDWPGWLVWEIAVQKKYFDDAGVKVEMMYMEYDQTFDAFAAGKVDGVCVVCGDALTIGDKSPSTAIVLTDYSNGNDAIIGGEGVESIKDLKGKKVGVELNHVEHLLLVKALEKNGLKEEDVQLVNVETSKLPASLRSKSLAAIGVWYPISGEALKVPKAKAIFTSADEPGLIYDALHVNRKSLKARRDDWKKVVEVWFKCLDFLQDKKTHDEAVKIMAERIGADVKPAELEKNLEGTKLLDGAANVKAMKKGDKLDSVHGSMKVADQFYVKTKFYADERYDEKYVDASLVKEVVEAREKKK